MRQNKRGLARLLSLVGVVLVLGGCQVTVTAGVEAKDDGSGVVRASVGLDEEAVRAAGDVAQQLRTEDLRQTGWTVTGPAREADGLTWVRASKPFGSPAQATTIMTELAGAGGPLRDLVLRQERSLLKLKTTFAGFVDLSRGVAGFVDDDLRAKLGDAVQFDDSAFGFEFTADVPGGSETWRPAIGQQTPLRLEAQEWRLVPAIPAMAAIVFAGVAVVLVVRRRV